MARITNKLSARRVSTASKPGMYGDGAGLFLNIGPNGAKSWIFRYSSPTAKRPLKPQFGKQRDMGIGPIHTISLAEAREKALECRKLVLASIDPLDHRTAQQAALRLEAARTMTFDQCATAYIEAHKAGWKNAKHAEQWQSTLDTYVSPVFGALPVQAVDVALVMKAVQPIWKTKTETANRVRGRIEAILDWAEASKFRQGDNPARWKESLKHLLAPRAKVTKVVHHPALPYAEVGSFVAELRTQRSIGALALEFTILTAARTSEAIGAEWSEIDLTAKVWTVPAGRIKGGKEHRVPLSPRALAILKELKQAGGRHVFPGLKPGKPLSNMAMLALLERMGRDDLTVHGFRSTFRDWAAECTGYPNEVVEMALAHAVGDKVEAAYRRGDLLEKRYLLMAEWAEFCSKPAPAGDNVVPIRGSAAVAG